MNKALLEPVNIIPPEQTAVSVVTPMEMLSRAVQSGADIDMIEKLMVLQERWDASNARKAFDKAVSAAKKEIPPITRNAKGHNDKRYADFAAIARVVDPILGNHGLSYRFKTNQTAQIAVTCILSHEAGHSEETTLSAPPDPSGNKSAIHAIGSTLTYLQRYSLVQMLGLAAAADDDGKAAASVEAKEVPAGSITFEQAAELREALEEKGASERAFINWASNSTRAFIPEGHNRLDAIKADAYPACKAAIAGFKKA